MSGPICMRRRMAPKRHLATMSHEDYEANWNGQADGQDHVLSQADALTNNNN